MTGTLLTVVPQLRTLPGRVSIRKSPCNVLFQEALLTEIPHVGWHRAVKSNGEQSALFGLA